MEICEKERCTACRACMCICPKDSITFQEDEKGFAYPVIGDSCVNCGACLKICPRNTGMALNTNTPEVFAAFSKDKKIRKNSSSGGLFSEVAKYILNQGGVVFAARLNESQKEVIFDCCKTVEELKLFQGSKYIQSNPGVIYRQIKKVLADGIKVLFVGVPCQVDGLKKYLHKDYSNLVTIDIICHGAPSPKLWREYLEKLEASQQAKASSVSFRYKKPNWTRFSLKVDFDNNTTIRNSKFDDPYLIAFLKEISMRENCHSCEYTSTSRTGDITLADFWGYHSYDFKMRNTEKGISLVLVNTEKGKQIFNDIQDSILSTRRTMKEAISGNRSLQMPWKKNDVSDAFWNEYLHGEGMSSALKKYCVPYRFPKKMYMTWFALNHMYLIPKPLLSVRKKLREGGGK
ncbi:Coenzyme F420 hydrogenase/dehydrogenase, beta subunit C-terminal domain [Blautia wexlerae]|uniref:Coenzyme F420 hydrogenase/dehydrogenase, beta subunit C-terminal domain n=1 Tax=Blautia wexlerae TaxID=418240 RepID=UPI001899D000|nr:Coenzyme F420 hydrogenase/dehydrogenase, beta subunit C-terminal domain [Blautia wexlerae]